MITAVMTNLEIFIQFFVIEHHRTSGTFGPDALWNLSLARLRCAQFGFPEGAWRTVRLWCGSLNGRQGQIFLCERSCGHRRNALGGSAIFRDRI